MDYKWIELNGVELCVLINGTIYKKKGYGYEIAKHILDSNGYIGVNFRKKNYRLHRILGYAFLGLDINDSSQIIDHINMIRDDNRLENLRIVTKAQNGWNTDSCGFTICKNRNKKFMVRIVYNHKKIYIGHFYTEEEAQQAYLDAKIKYHIIPETKNLHI